MPLRTHALLEAVYAAYGLAWERLGAPGGEAAIQSAHAERAFTGRVPWGGIAQLDHGLLQIAPTLGAHIGHAVALGTAHGAERGQAALDAMPEAEVRNLAPWWVARAHLLEQQRRWLDAATSLRHGMGLTNDPRLRTHLWLKLQALQAAPVTDTPA